MPLVWHFHNHIPLYLETDPCTKTAVKSLMGFLDRAAPIPIERSIKLWVGKGPADINDL